MLLPDRAVAYGPGRSCWIRKKTVERIPSMVSRTGQQPEIVPMDICADLSPEGIGKIALAKIALAKIDVDMSDAIGVVEDPTALPDLQGAYLALDELMQNFLGRNFMAVPATMQYLLIRVQQAASTSKKRREGLSSTLAGALYLLRATKPQAAHSLAVRQKAPAATTSQPPIIANPPIGAAIGKRPVPWK